MQNKMLRRIFSSRFHRAYLVLAVVAIYALAFIAPAMLQRYGTMTTARSDMAFYLLVTIPYVFVQTYACFFALTISRWLCFIFMPLLWACSVLAAYAAATYGITLSAEVIAASVEATSHELNEFLHPALFIWPAIGGILGLLCAWIIFSREKPSPNNVRAAFLCMMVFIGSIMNGEVEKYAPYNFLHPTYAYGVQRAITANLPPRRDISELPIHHTPKQWPEVVVLVIGESARGDHFSLNGYSRETNPLLAKRGQLVSFSHAKSCDVWTRTTIGCILTRSTPQDFKPLSSETSAISLFRKLGFHTVWLSSQGHFSPADTTSYIQPEAHDRQFISAPPQGADRILDEHLLPLLDKAMAKHADKPLFVVMHMLGSHWQYAARYPDHFERYKPACGMTMERYGSAERQREQIKKCTNLQETINSYDNSILYTDYVLDQIIGRLEGKRAMFVYLSDHGESLGEEGRLLHGHEGAPENYHIPMMWWASDSFLQNPMQSSVWGNLVAKKNQPVGQEVMFHSLLDCIGVQGEAINPRHSLCR
jgi:glucan phosphoethanolaminetransferase (alkaline phosphatase superfamily)